MSHIARGLSMDRPVLGSFSSQQNRAILIVAVTCASISLLATLITLRWFVLMRRLFRHHLVLFLIVSDTVKALSYFVFPIVVFANGPVASSSNWCQASGFFLSLSIEASDFAILLIALHAVLYVFRPPIRFGEGGLYPYRKWLPVAWLLFPLLAASLAFINSKNGYVTAGTFCYLPQRPFWYRLALAWIPRYLILITILAMYVAISIYVRIKFRSFKNLQHSESSSGFESARRSSLAEIEMPVEKTGFSKGKGTLSPLFESPSPRMPATQPSSPHLAISQNSEPWDSVAFITSSPFIGTTSAPNGVAAADFAAGSGTSSVSEAMSPTMKPEDHNIIEKRKSSESPTVSTTVGRQSFTTGSQVDSTIDDPRDKIITDPLKRTRLAIRQQLRFLFIYPAVYVLMWAFPFANHCLLYSDYLATRPIFWLQILSTCSLALQAAANCLIFSTREKPWRRVDEESKFSLIFWRRHGGEVVRNIAHKSSPFGTPPSSDTITERRTTNDTDITYTENTRPKMARGPTWWEAEGKKRKDSVWLGTDLMTYITSREAGGTPSTKSQEAEDNSPRSPA